MCFGRKDGMKCIMVVESQEVARMETVILCCLAAKLSLLWKSSKIDGGQTPFLLPKPKGADIFSSHFLAARAQESAQPIGHFHQGC